jgi:hypothetical protein
VIGEGDALLADLAQGVGQEEQVDGLDGQLLGLGVVRVVLGVVFHKVMPLGT